MYTRFGKKLVMRALPALLAAAALCPRAASGEPLAVQPQYTNIAGTFAMSLPALHLTGRAIDDETAARALKLYLTMLDGDHSFFLGSDVDRFIGQVTNLDDMIKAGDVSVAFDIARTYRQRAAERCEFVKKTLARKPDLARKEKFQWRRRGLDTPWPAGRKEQDELWRKKIEDQYIRRVIAVEADEQRKKEAAKAAATNAAEKAGGSGTAAAAGSTNVPAAAVAGTGTNRQKTASLPDEQLSPEQFIIKQYEQFLTVMQDTDSEWVFQQYLSAFARAFDPHSEYMSPSEVENFNISMKLSLGGIGALLTSEDGAAKVVRIIPKGPAEKDGRLQPGDKIIGVGEQGGEIVDVLHWPLNKIVDRIRGKKETTVVLSVIPAADISSTVTIEIRRDEVKLEEQAAQGSVKELAGRDGRTNKLGIITLPGFYADMEGARVGAETRSVSADVRRVLGDLKQQGVQGVLVDLRNNGGGALAEAVKLTGFFMTLGPVVQVKDRRNVVVLRDTDPVEVYDGPMVVLVNRMSASASEIFAGAMQDYGRAVIVGDSRTHGKGTVQAVLPLSATDPKSGSMKVTQASFFRITGASTQERGVEADIVVASPLSVMEIGEEYLDYRLPWSQTEPADSRPINTGNFIGDIILWSLGGTSTSNRGPELLRPVIEQVRKMSQERRSRDQRFVLQDQLVKRYAEKLKETEISINLEERRADAREEMRLMELQEEALAGADMAADTPPADSKRGDIVLEEAGKILNDMIDLDRPAAAPATGN